MSQAPVASATILSRLPTHLHETFRLALPVIVSRAGLMVMMTINTIIVGHYSAEQLAHYGLAILPSNMMVSTGVGLLMGTVAMTAHALGAGQFRECGQVWRRSLPFALLLGMVFGLICLTGPWMFTMLGQKPELVRGGSDVLMWLGLGMPGMMLFIATAFFLEGLKKPLPSMIAMVLGNVVNAALAWVLVNGGLGMPEMGAAGSALATSIVRWGMGLGLVIYAWNLREREIYGVRERPRHWWRDSHRQRNLGYAAGLSILIESGAFSGLGIYAGWISEKALAAYTIGLNLIALPFMAANGLAAATQVRVAVASGQGDRIDVALAGWSGLIVTSVLLSLVGVVYNLWPEAVSGLYTSDPELLLRVSALVGFAAWVLVVDGGQVVMAQALRGRGDTWIPTALHFLSYGAIMLPVSALLAFHMGHEEFGLFEGIFIASVVSVAVLSARFALLARR